jgi:hypothetical protein
MGDLLFELIDMLDVLTQCLVLSVQLQFSVWVFQLADIVHLALVNRRLTDVFSMIELARDLTASSS